ncbi:MAG: 2-oxoacid:acceptor oxidoreductase family protein [bacterium]|nr:MAG: 2-oxoacid:acceptor oxidoreductase family protein [bacterium]
MIEVRFHGRGGQGAVTAAELVAQAAISENRYAQGFPNFGAERRGAPVTAYLRVSDTPICLREKIEHPDIVVVLDPSLMSTVDVCEGLKEGGTVVVNSPAAQSGEFDALKGKYLLALADADRIALEVLGVPIVNTAMIGALVQATDIVDGASLEGPVKQRFGRLAEKNLKAIARAGKETTVIGTADSSSQGRGSAGVPPGDQGLRIDALHAWEDLEIGCDIPEPGSTVAFQTGNWRTTGRPVTDYEKCVQCGLCWILCPDSAYLAKEEGGFVADERYCKGCGICAAQCPKKAIEMKGEDK